MQFGITSVACLALFAPARAARTAALFVARAAIFGAFTVTYLVR